VRFFPGAIPYRISVKCRGFRVRDRGRRFPSARATAHRTAGGWPNAGTPAACAVHSRRGRRLSGPDPRDPNPPSFGHFVKDVTGPLLSSCARLTGGRPKRCVRSGAAASVHVPKRRGKLQAEVPHRVAGEHRFGTADDSTLRAASARRLLVTAALWSRSHDSRQVIGRYHIVCPMDAVPSRRSRHRLYRPHRRVDRGGATGCHKRERHSC
jgi:hypothetical protein